MKTLQNLLILEGGIAAGKTTLLFQLAKKYNLYPIEEPVVNNPYLEKFYEDPKKWAFEFQLWFLNQRIEHYKHACEIAEQNPDQTVILDRSVFSDYVFALNGFQDGLISQDQFDQYMVLYDTAIAQLALPTAVVYLNVSPETCLYRIKSIRKRDFEMGIPLEYLVGLDDCYHKLIEQLKSFGCQVYNVDWKEFGSPETIYAFYESAKIEICAAE